MVKLIQQIVGRDKVVEGLIAVLCVQETYRTVKLAHGDQRPRLLDHAVVNFPAKDILTFLGRKLSGNFLGEVLTDCKKKRDPGARIKHRMKENWIKMYDKFGLVLRVETVINSPREFKVRRTRMRQGKPTKV